MPILTILLALLTLIAGFLIPTVAFWFFFGSNAKGVSPPPLAESTSYSDYSRSTLNSGCGLPKEFVSIQFGTFDALLVINHVANKFKISPSWVAAIMEQESNFNPDATSSAGAGGLMQLMPGTFPENYQPADYKDKFKTLILENDAFNPPASNELARFHPGPNSYAGTNYFRKQLDAFGGNYRLALAAFNAGPGNARSGYWQAMVETINYVRQVPEREKKFAACRKGDKLVAGSGPNIPAEADENGKKVLDQAGKYKPGTCSNINCYEHTRAVYAKAGMTPDSSDFLDKGYGSQITASPKPGYIMDLDLDGNGNADHTVLFDHEEIVDGQRVWYFWNADATNDWVYTDKAPDTNSKDPRVPWLPDQQTNGLPVHMWKPVPIK